MQDRLDNHVRKMKRTVVHSQHAVSPSALNQSPADIACRSHFGLTSAMTGEPAPHALPDLSPVTIAGQSQPPRGVVNADQMQISLQTRMCCLMHTLCPNHRLCCHLMQPSLALNSWWQFLTKFCPCVQPPSALGSDANISPAAHVGRTALRAHRARCVARGTTQPTLTVDCTGFASTVSALGI